MNRTLEQKSGAITTSYFVTVPKEWKKPFVNGGDKSELETCHDHGLKHYRKNPLKEAEQGAILNHMDITNEWTKKDKKGSVVERLSYIVDGINYIVDGKHVKLKTSEKERAVAATLSEKYGKQVELVPQVVYPQKIQTPDDIIDGERYDLKSPEGNSKNLFYNMVSNKKKQAPNFIFDVTNCFLSDEEIGRQIKNLYFSKHTLFIEKIVILRNGEVWKVYSRK